MTTSPKMDDRGLTLADWLDEFITSLSPESIACPFDQEEFGKLHECVAALRQDSSGGVEVCCQEFETCSRPCVPRGIELGKSIQASADKFAATPQESHSEVLERAITLFETFAEYGMQEKWPDGTPTPNSSLCWSVAKELRALASRADKEQK